MWPPQQWWAKRDSYLYLTNCLPLPHIHRHLATPVLVGQAWFGGPGGFGGDGGGGGDDGGDEGGGGGNGWMHHQIVLGPPFPGHGIGVVMVGGDRAGGGGDA